MVRIAAMIVAESLDLEIAAVGADDEMHLVGLTDHGPGAVPVDRADAVTVIGEHEQDGVPSKWLGQAEFAEEEILAVRAPQTFLPSVADLHQVGRQTVVEADQVTEIRQDRK